jgi:predicted amidophosphoribosyltransferase
MTVITMASVVCPACAVVLPKRNRGCPHCHYSFSQHRHGRVGSLQEMIDAKQGDYNNVTPDFLRLLVAAGVVASNKEA